MTRNSRRNTRAARRQRLDRLQATVEGLQGMHQRAAARAALAGAALHRADAALRDRDAELSSVRRSQAQLIAGAGALVAMVDRSCIAHPVPKVYAIRRCDVEQRRFAVSVRENIDVSYPDDVAGKVRSIYETMHLMSASAVRDEMNRAIH